MEATFAGFEGSSEGMGTGLIADFEIGDFHIFSVHLSVVKSANLRAR